MKSHRAGAFASALLLVACAGSRTPPPTLGAELIAMRDSDQATRRRWLEDQKDPERIAEVKAVDAKNLARLKEILHRWGWPRKSDLGEKEAAAAWTIAQHGDAAFLRDVLPRMEEAMKRGDLGPGLYATSLDRVLISEGKKQRYGSQFDTAGDRCEPLPIEDPEHVDERRRAMALGPLAEYTQQLCALYKQKQK